MGCSLPTSTDFPCFTCLSELEVLQNSLEGSEIIRISWGPQVVLKANKNGDRKVEVLQKKNVAFNYCNWIWWCFCFSNPFGTWDCLFVWFGKKRLGTFLFGSSFTFTFKKRWFLNAVTCVISQCAAMRARIMSNLGRMDVLGSEASHAMPSFYVMVYPPGNSHIPPNGKRKIIFKMDLFRGYVGYVSSQEGIRWYHHDHLITEILILTYSYLFNLFFFTGRFIGNPIMEYDTPERTES